MAEIPTPTAGYSAPSGERPMGVTILAILQIVGGVLGLVLGIMALMVASLLGIFGFLLVIVAGVATLFAVLGLIVGWGLWSLKSWAWMFALIINIINLVLALISFDLVSMIIPLIIVIYLQQGEIKRTFR
jgi:uncharacterized membrane protein (DUF2068 family)